MRGECRKSAAPHFLVALGEFAGDRGVAVAEHRRHIGKAGGETRRAFVKD